MLNNEKSILVVYVDITNFKKEQAMQLLNNVKSTLESKFYNRKHPEDDSLVIIVMPADRTEIVLLNSKYPDYEQLKKDAEQILENLKKSN